MLALSQSIPTHESIASSALPGRAFAAANQAQPVSSSPSLSFSDTLATVQTENTSPSFSTPVSFASGTPLQNGTTQYPARYQSQSLIPSPKRNSVSTSTQSSNGERSASVSAPSDRNQARPPVQKSAGDSSTDHASAGRDSAGNDSADNEITNQAAVQASSDSSQRPQRVADCSGDDPNVVISGQTPSQTDKSNVQSVQTNPSPVGASILPVSANAAPADAAAAAPQMPTSDTAATLTSPPPEQRRSALVPSPTPQATSVLAAKAGDLSKQEPTKRHRKTNEVAPAGGASGAPADSLAPTLLEMATSSATAPTDAAASPAAPSDSNAAAVVADSNNRLTVSPSPANSLAFAVKLQSAGSTSGGGNVPVAGLHSDTPSADLELSKSAEPPPPLSGSAPVLAQPTSPNGAASIAQFSHSPALTLANDAGSQQTSGAPANSAQVMETDRPDADDSAVPAAPLRSMQVQINGQDDQRIDLRLVERSGSLSMSVRSLDPSLNRSLQDHLPELMTKLASQPGQAEWWTPSTQTAGSAHGSGDGDGTKDDSSGSQRQQNQGGQDSGGQQSGRENNQPKWVQELAALNTSKTTGKETIWHQ